MKSLRNKVILSGIVLVFAFIATIGSTFAWFTVSQTVAVQEMQLNVSAEDNLLILVDNGYNSLSTQVTTIENYKTSLTLAEITAAGTAYENLTSYRLLPVTALNSAYNTVDGKNLGVLEALTDYDRSVTAAVANNATTGHFIELKFWLYSQSTLAKQIQLSNVSITSSETDPELVLVEDAVRLAVFTDTSDAFIFGNDTDFGFGFLPGQEGHSSVVTPTDTDFNNLFERTTPILDGLGGNLLTSITGADRVKNLANESTTPTDLFELPSQTPTLVTIRIFIEGWDAQAKNNIVSAQFEIVLGFKFKQA